jgi:hypothetical protein
MNDSICAIATTRLHVRKGCVLLIQKKSGRRISGHSRRLVRASRPKACAAIQRIELLGTCAKTHSLSKPCRVNSLHGRLRRASNQIT